MSADDLPFAKAISPRCYLLVFSAHQRECLPALQPITMAKVKERVWHVAGYHVFLPRFGIQREHRKINFIPEKPLFEMTVDGKYRRVILAGISRTLLEIDRKEAETPGVFVPRVLSSRKAEKLKELPPVFCAKTDVGKYRIREVKFLVIGGRIFGVGKCQHWNAPLVLRFYLLGKKARPENLCPLARRKGQRKSVIQRPGADCIFRERPPWNATSKTQTKNYQVLADIQKSNATRQSHYFIFPP